MPTYAEISRKIAELQKQADELRVQEAAQVIENIRDQISTYSLTVEDLFGKSRKGQTTVAVRYRDSNGNAWSGRGKRPRWLAEALNAGETLESFKVA